MSEQALKVKEIIGAVIRNIRNMKNRKDIPFHSLPEGDQDWHLRHTWCNSCGKADLGINEPELCIEGGKKYIAGKCVVCGSGCVSEVSEHKADG